MSRAPLVSLLALAFAPLAPAQTLVPPAAPTTTPPAGVAGPRRTPSAMATRLAENAPKFNPNPAVPEPAPASADDSAEIAPKNQILRLPRVVVEAYRPLNLKDRQVLTPEEKLKLAFKAAPALHLGNTFGANRLIAEAMIADAERLQRKEEAQDLVSLMQIVSPEAAKQLQREAWRAYMRPPDFGRTKGAQGTNSRLGMFFDRVVD